jgi:hypothetical protein
MQCILYKQVIDFDAVKQVIFKLWNKVKKKKQFITATKGKSWRETECLYVRVHLKESS